MTDDELAALIRSNTERWIRAEMEALCAKFNEIHRQYGSTPAEWEIEVWKGQFIWTGHGWKVDPDWWSLFKAELTKQSQANHLV